MSATLDYQKASEIMNWFLNVYIAKAVDEAHSAEDTKLLAHLSEVIPAYRKIRDG